MCVQDLGVSTSGLAAAVIANSSKIKSQYHSQFSAVLAERNAVKHKKRDVDDGERTCHLNAGGMFRWLVASRTDPSCLRCPERLPFEG